MNADRFREILSHWAATVAVAAVRDDGQVHGTTVTSFTPVDVDPALVLVSLGPNAQVRPFLGEGRRYAINFLAESQRRLAEVYADPFPVGPSPFPGTGDPVIPNALGHLVCEVTRRVDVEGGALVVLGRVVDGAADPGLRPLIWHRRHSTRLADD